MVELEEIQCPMCKEQFSEQVRIPMLLPDCGHSYCLKCIEENSTDETFAKGRSRSTVTEGNQQTVDGDRPPSEGNEDSNSKDDDEDLTSGTLPEEMLLQQYKFSFKCPEDG